MSTSYFVRYDGPEPLSNEFLQYYRTNHANILRQFPGIQELHLHTATDISDSEQVNAGEVSLLAQMVFPDSHALNEALMSDVRKLARDDMKRFPTFTARVIHQAMSTETVFSTPTK